MFRASWCVRPDASCATAVEFRRGTRGRRDTRGPRIFFEVFFADRCPARAVTVWRRGVGETRPKTAMTPESRPDDDSSTDAELLDRIARRGAEPDGARRAQATFYQRHV